MYENVTYESILQRMLERIPNTMDKREGSIIYDALAPAAIELQLMYLELDVIMRESFADTASREYLVRRAAERGIAPESATNAVLKGVFTPSDINVLGKRFSCNTLNYTVTECIGNGEWMLQCETTGKEGNATFGALIPIEYIDGFERGELTELLIPAEDEEETETFRQRYFDSFESHAFGGNVADYREKTNSIDGVGATKVTPVWDGGGTVLLTIVDSNFRKPSQELIAVVQETIDPMEDGRGVGIAPIGHVVTVRGAEELQLNVTTSITFGSGYDFDSLKDEIDETIETYLAELRKDWGGNYLTIRSSQIDARLLDIDGIIDIENTRINDMKNLTTNGYQIPVLGGVVND